MRVPNTEPVIPPLPGTRPSLVGSTAFRQTLRAEGEPKAAYPRVYPPLDKGTAWDLRTALEVEDEHLTSGHCTPAHPCPVVVVHQATINEILAGGEVAANPSPMPAIKGLRTAPQQPVQATEPPVRSPAASVAGAATGAFLRAFLRGPRGRR